MNAIVAIDENFGIGYEQQLLCKNKEDLARFKALTLNKIVIMGRSTLDSLPNGMPLKQRTNIVLSRDPNYTIRNNEIRTKSVEETLQTINSFNSDDVFVIGGEEIYKLFLPYCSKLYLTYITKTFIANKHFPNIKHNPNWRLYHSQKSINNEYMYFKTYHNVNPKKYM